MDRSICILHFISFRPRPIFSLIKSSDKFNDYYLSTIITNLIYLKSLHFKTKFKFTTKIVFATVAQWQHSWKKTLNTVIASLIMVLDWSNRISWLNPKARARARQGPLRTVLRRQTADQRSQLILSSPSSRENSCCALWAVCCRVTEFSLGVLYCIVCSYSCVCVGVWRERILCNFQISNVDNNI